MKVVPGAHNAMAAPARYRLNYIEWRFFEKVAQVVVPLGLVRADNANTKVLSPLGLSTRCVVARTNHGALGHERPLSLPHA